MEVAHVRNKGGGGSTSTKLSQPMTMSTLTRLWNAARCTSSTRFYSRPNSNETFFQSLKEKYGGPTSVDFLHFTYYETDDEGRRWLYKKVSLKNGAKFFIKEIEVARQAHDSSAMVIARKREIAAPMQLPEMATFDVMRFSWSTHEPMHLDITKFPEGQFQVLLVTASQNSEVWHCVKGAFPNIIEYLRLNKDSPSSRRLGRNVPQLLVDDGVDDKKLGFPESFFQRSTIGPLLAREWILKEKLPEFVGDAQRCWEVFRVCKVEDAQDMMPDFF